MTRPTLAKLAYVAALLTLLALAAGVIALVPAGPQRIVVSGLGVVLLLVPGRLQARLLRAHFAGRAAHAKGHFTEARRLYEQQLEELRAAPWKNRAVWLSWMVWTTRADAMVWNNLAAVAIDAGDLNAIEPAAAEALAIDPLYPLPWVQRAAAAAMRGDREEVERCVEQAALLGYRGTTADALIMRVNAAYGRLQAGG